MTQHHELLKHLGDIGASISGAFLVVSHFAELATPILTFLIALLTAAWWIMRWAKVLKDD